MKKMRLGACDFIALIAMPYLQPEEKMKCRSLKELIHI
jgi:hypothetical protein